MSGPEEDDRPDEAVTHEHVALRAYELYVARGREDGHDLADWLEAEAEIFGRTLEEIAPEAPRESLRPRLAPARRPRLLQA